MKGASEVESEEGKGTTFHIRLHNLSAAKVQVNDKLAGVKVK